MMLYEMRIFAVLGVLAVGLLALAFALAVLHLRAGARRLNNGVVRGRTLPSLRGDTHDAARLIDHRQAAWRLRC